MKKTSKLRRNSRGTGHMRHYGSQPICTIMCVGRGQMGIQIFRSDNNSQDRSGHSSIHPSYLTALPFYLNISGQAFGIIHLTTEIFSPFNTLSPLFVSHPLFHVTFTCLSFLMPCNLILSLQSITCPLNG